MMYGPKMASGYDRGRSLRADDVDRWMAAARPYLPGRGGHVLDLGAGTGRFTDALARSSGAQMLACEPSPAMRAVFRANHPRTTIVAGTAEAPPFQAAAFDAVWASQVIHHVGDLSAFATNLRRVLRPGGHLLLRGGFGPAKALPLYRYFPLAWAPGSAALLPLDRIATALADVDIATVGHATVEQTFAENAAELIEKVQSRSLSPLAALSDQTFQEGLRTLRRDAAEGRITEPIVEHLDLVVFRSLRAPAATD